jgi:dUTP pyrophosphatase
LLEVQLLEAGAKAPVVATPGEDLGYDLFALEDTDLLPGEVKMVRTGIAVAAYAMSPEQKWNKAQSDRLNLCRKFTPEEPLGLLIRDRSSMAVKGITTSGGVIDAGYRGELKILMTSVRFYRIEAGQKIAQMVPQPVLTGDVYVVGKLEEAKRGAAGFGSSGK